MPEIDGFTLARHLRERNRSRPTVVMMLPPVDRKTEIAQCRELGIQAYITKLYKDTDLTKALSNSSQFSECDINLISEDKASQDSTVPGQSLNLLLVDDNPFNQKVGSLKLEKLGHKVTIAGSGKEALAILEKASFEIIFMDMHMPEMDGLETTTRIRSQEVGKSRTTPIVAMTANAGEEARQQCLQGGMDAYVAKPIEDRELLAVIASVASAHGQVALPPAAEPAPPASPPVITRDALLARVSGNLAMLRELISVFRQDSPPIVGLLAQALEVNDCQAVHHQSHTLKGMINFFGVPAISDLAFQLEKMGKAGDCSRGRETLDTLRHELEGMQAELDQM
jgi:two-component system sensor histidine kinase/response regulator